MDNRAKIIILQGDSGVGKDTFYELYEESCLKFGIDTIDFAFAELLKTVTCSILGEYYSIIEIYKRDENKRFDILGNRNLREFYKDFSELLKDFLGKDIFAKIVSRQIKNYKHYKTIIITDLRFQEEIDTIQQELSKDFDIYNIYIYKGEENKYKNKFFYNFAIDNSGTLEEYKKNIKRLMKKIEGI